MDRNGFKGFPNDNTEEKNPYQQVLDLSDNELFVKGISDLPQDKPLSIDEAMDLLIDVLKRDILKSEDTQQRKNSASNSTLTSGSIRA